MSEEVLIEVDNASAGSQDDPDRAELLWSSRQEKVLRVWQTDMLKRSKVHAAKATKYKRLYTIFGLPSALIPIVLSTLSGVLKDHELANSLLLLVAGVLVATTTFLNLGKRFAVHAEFETHYDQLARRVDKELAKPKRHRIACDVYMEKIELKLSGLNSRAPS